MTFLAPALLGLGLAVASPLVLHLLQRHQGPRMTFPALRYLQRAEREHATRIRLRQVLLLALRVLALLLLAAAAARPFLRGGGTGHQPTDVVIVLDNSMSAGAVVGERRVLDRLSDAALDVLDLAGPDDRFWLIRAGTPWEPAITGDARTVAEAIRRTEPAGGAADVSAEIERAASILATGEPDRAREIHLIGDLQASAMARLADADDAAPPISVLVPDFDPPANRAVVDVELGGGLPPRSDERSSVAVTLAATGGSGAPAADSVSARLVLDGSVRAAATIPAGGAAVIPFPAREAGLVTGHVEIDADALLADDRRHFVARVEPPPSVATGEAQEFLDEALAVLQDAGRLRLTAPVAADVVLAPGGHGADRVRTGAGVVVLPPSSPLETAAANQRLSAAGIPWRFGTPAAGEARLRPAAEGDADDAPDQLAEVLAEVRLRQVYGLEPQGDAAAGDSVLLRLRGGEPWAIAGETAAGGRYVVLATPLTAEGGTIPLSAAMLPLLDRAIGAWARGGDERPDHRPGDVVTLPPGDSVVGPAGATALIGAGTVHRLEQPGVYRVLSGGETVAAYAVNPPPAESRLDRLDRDAVASLLPGREVSLAGPEGFTNAVFHARLGQEISWPLILAALLLLLVEMAVAATGRGTAGRRVEAAAPGAASRP